jgi:spore coat protein U-like protein
VKTHRILKFWIVAWSATYAVPALANVTCTNTVTNVVFGTYSPINTTPLNSSGQITVTCTLIPKAEAANVAYTISLSAGLSGSLLSRTMVSGPNFLVYNLFTTSGYTQVWGNGLSGSAVVNGSMKLGRSAGSSYTDSRIHPVHGRIPTAQDVPPGNYADAIVVTVTY